MNTVVAIRPFDGVPGARSAAWLPLLVYIFFAALIYAIHGLEPPLSIDHLSYFKLADEIIGEYPDRDYYRGLNSVRAYGVILAYMHAWTGSHLVSLKLLLAVITVGYLAAFQLFMRLATPSRTEAVLFSLLSALFVSFGASIWGMTDFAASLNRSLVVPFVVLLVWFFFRFFDSPWRYAIYPALVLCSQLHLSALHVFLVFGVFEGLDWIFRRRLRITRDLAYFALGLAAAGLVQSGMEMMGTGTANFVRYTLNVATLAKPAPKPPAEAQPPVKVATGPAVKAPAAPAPAATSAAPKAAASPAPAPSSPAATPAPAKPAAPAAPREPMFKSIEPAAAPEPKKAEEPPAEAKPAETDATKAQPTPLETPRLNAAQAWEIEMFAFPWRNMPLSLATLLTLATSFGVIFLLAAGGAVLAFRRGEATRLDRSMLVFAAAVVIASYGFQTVLWVARNVMAIFPVNFEEVRAVNNIMFPAVYFVYRLFHLARPAFGLSQRTIRILIVAAFVLQPIVILRSLPTSWREGIIAAAVDGGIIKRTDAPRMIYARQFLGLADEGRRFYYSARDAIRWLDQNAQPNELVLTNVDAFIMLRAKTAGTFLDIVRMDVWDTRRGAWARSLDSVDALMATGDTERVVRFAKMLGASWAVVTWPVEGAAYRDSHFSIIRITYDEPI